MVARLFSYDFPHRKGLILQYNNGWGEIAPLPGLSRESLNEALFEISSLLPHLDTAKPTLPSVQFGLHCAKRPFSLDPLKTPVAAFQIPEQGCTTLKLKAGHLSPDEAIDLVSQYKSRHHLRIDCNQRWNLEQALYFASHFTPSDFDYIEEPVSRISDLIEFSRQTRFPIAVDESLHHPLLFKIPTLKTIVVKPMILGSVPKFPISTVLSSTYETSLGHLLIARLASPFSPPQGLGTYRLCEDNILNPPLKISDGCLTWSPSKSPINIDQLCLIASVP